MRSATRVASAYMSKEALSGLFGFTKAIQRDGESAIKKVKKQAEKISTQLEKRHPEAGVYFTLRCNKAGCVPSKALAKTCIFNKPQTRILKVILWALSLLRLRLLRKRSQTFSYLQVR